MGLGGRGGLGERGTGGGGKGEGEEREGVGGDGRGGDGDGDVRGGLQERSHTVKMVEIRRCRLQRA